MFNRLSLRIQLLASYLLMLGIVLAVIAGAMLYFFSTRPAPPEPTYQRLLALARGLNLRDVVSEYSTPGRMLPTNLGDIVEGLDELGESRSVRVLWIAARDDEVVVLHDTADVYTGRETVNIHTDASVVSSSGGLQQMVGSFLDPDNSEWLFAGVATTLTLPRSSVTSVLLLAEPRPTLSLQDVLGGFASSLLPPLLQAGLIGLIAAALLAFLISRGLARPLQALAEGASAVSRGDLHHEVRESGPTEVRAVAQAFNQMRTDVSAAQQAQREFLANVSHDLKTPLTSIQGYAQAIMDGAARNPGDAAQIIYDEAARLNRLVVELTDLVRMQSGRLSMKMDGVDVGQIAAAIGQRLSVVARDKQVTLDVQADTMPLIAADGDRIAQVLTNLISNAIKFTPTGGRVLLRTGVRDGGVEIVVRDNGIGIAPEDLPRVFDRFYQVDKTRGPRRGTGLGLAITREIVHAHGGTIQVSSPGVGKGTTFTIWLPSPQLSTIMARRPVH